MDFDDVRRVSNDQGFSLMRPAIVHGLVALMDLKSVLRYVLASTEMRRSISTNSRALIVVFDGNGALADRVAKERELFLRWLACEQEAERWLPTTGAEPLVVLWEVGKRAPGFIDWDVVPWTIACRNLEVLKDVSAELAAAFCTVPEEATFEKLVDRIEVLGTATEPLTVVPPPELSLPRLRQIWVDSGVAAAWPKSLRVDAMRIIGALSAGAPLSQSLKVLRLSGTEPDDLEAIDAIAPELLELEVESLDVMAPEDDWRDAVVETVSKGLDEPPCVHGSPDPSRFLSLRRLQAELTVESVVILGRFAASIPSLRRLGTIVLNDDYPECYKKTFLDFVPRNLEECVIDCGSTFDLPCTLDNASLACTCLQLRATYWDESISFQLQLVAGRNIRPGGWCVVDLPHMDVADRSLLLDQVQGSPSFMQKHACFRPALLWSWPLQSTPLERPLPFYSQD